MNIEEVREYCLSLPEVTESFPFDQQILTFKVADKIFLFLPLDALPAFVMVKCDPGLAIELRERYAEVQPGYHLNKKYWNSVYLSERLDSELITSWIFHSYQEVIKKLPRYKRKQLEEQIQ